MISTRDAVLGFIMAGALAFAAGPVLAGETASVTVKSDARFLTETDVNAMTGEIAVRESTLGVSYERKFGELPVDISFKARHIDLVTSDLPVDLPSHLEGRILGLSAKFPVPFVEADGYYMGLDLFPSMYTDDWDWHSGAFRLPFRTYFIYKDSDDLIFVAGVTVRPDYDSTVIPVLGVIYRPDERWSFNLASDDPNITYKLNDEARVFTEFGYTLDEYEVTRNGQNGVVLKYRSAYAGWGLTYTPTPSLEASLSAGAVFGRRLEYRDGEGKVEPDAAGYARVKLAWKF